MSVPSTQLFKIDDRLSFEEAALTEPVATCVHSLRSARLSGEETVLIFGVGVMGVLHVLLSQLYGVQTVVCDIDETRLEQAKAFGADVVVNPEKESLGECVRGVTEGRGADVVILATPAESAFTSALSVVRMGGRIVLFAASGQDYETTIIPDRLHAKEITLIGVQGRTTKDFQEAVTLLNRGRLNLKPVVSKTVPLEQISEGMKLALDRSTYRVVVQMST